MKASFNGARKNLASSYNSLIQSLNNYNLQTQNDKINELRNAIISLLCMYEDNNPDAIDMSDECKTLLNPK